mmetsp:Transcript_19473/g.54381  ORF Transcript_19473/g.54381 Transcript_19473/m.54381 type:complete len:153 (+) Transcript_19473:2306-2764(+)
MVSGKNMPTQESMTTTRMPEITAPRKEMRMREQHVPPHRVLLHGNGKNDRQPLDSELPERRLMPNSSSIVESCSSLQPRIVMPCLRPLQPRAGTGDSKLSSPSPGTVGKSSEEEAYPSMMPPCRPAVGSAEATLLVQKILCPLPGERKDSWA